MAVSLVAAAGRRVRRGLLVLLLALCGLAAAAHVTDRLVIGLYETPALQGEPQRLLASGTPIEVLARRAGKAQVRLGDGTTGWIEARYVSEEKPAAMQLLEARAEIRRLRQRLAGVRAGIELARARERIAELEQALAELPSLRAAAAERDELARRLQQVRDLLGAEAAEGVASSPASRSGADYSWSLAGLLMLAGFVAGVALVKLRLRRRYRGLRL
ncbi:TIGR04211 family SH3 domain-containing protein [endosymbiont of unidentified scaly snail isolate Monju]|uniref:TIGR04211 family SH3 domain-containing protein n=1 Tax=endosymbiont of unidentified scaly snail isolate Monju TaxID=1248727 RepID=UPI0009DD8D1B|nr:TIGR04211 family SH3 domain-containing protein [endosymbiont of unidentified scaly snail isolate Monju]